jgi:hypothetical protein
VSDRASPKAAGLVLVGAAVLGVIAIAGFSPPTGAGAPPPAEKHAQAVTGAERESRNGESGNSEAAGRFVAPVVPPERERIASPFSELGTDSAAAACAATRYPSGTVATLTAVLEDGWPGIDRRFDAAHAITLAAEDMCLQRTKPLFPSTCSAA